MLIQPPSHTTEDDRPSLPALVDDLLHIRARCFGATHHPVRLAIGSLATALILLMTQPPTALLSIVLVAGFLLLTVHLLFVADSALTRQVSGAAEPAESVGS